MAHHEPIILDKESWPQSHALVQYNLNRSVSNIHDMREHFHGVLLARTEKEVEQRECDLRRIDERFDSHGNRLTTMETRAVVYGAIAGALFGVATAVVMMLLRSKFGM